MHIKRKNIHKKKKFCQTILSLALSHLKENLKAEHTFYTHTHCMGIFRNARDTSHLKYHILIEEGNEG